MPRPAARKKPSIATIGYEGHSIGSFVAVLNAHGVRELVDVRELPLSRKKGFSKTGLSHALARHGIRYSHARRLGAPRVARHALREDGDFARFEEAYLRHLAREADALAELEVTARAGRTAIMCVEADATSCHRGLIARRLRNRGWRVVDLRA